MKNEQKNRYFSSNLLEWYRRHQRKLPWRESKDPYRIWISEVMLQQTRVDTVIPYYYRFLEKFPTVEALAYAPEDEVLKAWEGLGYYSRARNLQAAVREVQERYGGVVPSEKEEISSLKGVGPYTSGAILSIAYNKPEPAVDGNVMRVLSRFFLIEEDIAKSGTRVLMERLARELIPRGEAGDFNQALMELGAMVCTPRSPSCLTCPVMEHCGARLEGREESLPVKKKAKPPRPERRVAAFVLGTGELGGKFLIRQRPAEGLLARMWELPHYAVPAVGDGNASGGKPAGSAAAVKREAAGAAGGGKAMRAADTPLRINGEPLPDSADESLRTAEELRREDDARLMLLLRDSAASEDGLVLEPRIRMLDTEHIFSHIRWEMTVYECRIPMDGRHTAAPPPGYRWIAVDETDGYAFPNIFVRIIQEYVKYDTTEGTEWKRR